MFRINHIHLKSPDPKALADWFGEAFNLTIVSDTVRDFGDRFIGCDSEDGLRVNISGARTGEKMGPGDADPHYGLEHFGFDVVDMDEEIKAPGRPRRRPWPTDHTTRATAAKSPSSKPRTTFE